MLTSSWTRWRCTRCAPRSQVAACWLPVHDPRFRWIRRAGSCARTTAYGAVAAGTRRLVRARRGRVVGVRARARSSIACGHVRRPGDVEAFAPSDQVVIADAVVVIRAPDAARSGAAAHPSRDRKHPTGSHREPVGRAEDILGRSAAHGADRTSRRRRCAGVRGGGRRRKVGFASAGAFR
jgi:hypothetical protein